ncbi:hypothetical protein LOC68_05940 [Blastopirellula sp. JC732]|uniref:DUF4350 domain-containing protein n=1 Tax=Blastopirellula sediminis TaxID=2894196 RepID=A0A9X1SIB8_9BACT|nr:DUF4350 domain-containing protein [Blastopirellula sediminis]MCC9609294.1 hypothetical protein [Blastopirellula sediminis]MCC9627929.1 hypothetical protein [Blastopirellula sediminis]
MNSNLIRFVLSLAVALACVVAGCSSKEVKVPAQYGARNGYQKTSSVNGTHVLGELFRHAGYSVRTAERLSPRIEESDVIVWAPDSFSPPSPDVRKYLEEWLETQPGRTLIYIDRDFDASIEYWNAMLEQATPEQLLTAQREKGIAQHNFDQISAGAANKFDCAWYSVERNLPTRRPKRLTGRWTQGVDAAQTDIVLRSRIALSEEWEKEDDFGLAEKLPNSEVVLSTLDGKDPIVLLYTDDYDFGTQLIVVNGGSFLLNQPLVNHEHRKLAASLIEECGYGETVTFLESGDGGVEIITANEVSAGRSGWEWLTVWPISPLGLHIALLLIVFCFAAFPIFGRPKRLPEVRSSDFQKHIGALGELLEATDDYDYAQLRVRQYQQIARGDTVYRRVGRARVKP